jgi:hypothetical protein
MRQTVRGIFSRLKADLSREPGKPGRGWIFTPARWYFLLMAPVAVGVIYYALFISIPPSFLLTALGAYGLLGALAELLPRDRTGIAGILRAASVLCFALSILAILVLVFTG